MARAGQQKFGNLSLSQPRLTPGGLFPTNSQSGLFLGHHSSTSVHFIVPETEAWFETI